MKDGKSRVTTSLGGLFRRKLSSKRSAVPQDRAGESATKSNGDRATLLGSALGLDVVSFESMYTLGDKLNSGSFGSVWSGKHNISSLEFAVKVIDRSRLREKDSEAVYREVSILKSLSGLVSTAAPSNGENGKGAGDGSDGIINLVDFFEKPSTFHIVLELARGGDVFDRLTKRTVYTEAHAQDLARRLLKSINHIHSHGIVHRDLKPENLLLVDEVNDTNIKLGDFGCESAMRWLCFYYCVDALID